MRKSKPKVVKLGIEQTTAILAYPLPEHREEYMEALKGGDAHLVLWEILEQVLRPIWKHGAMPDKFMENGACTLTDRQQKVAIDTVEWLRDKIHEEMNQRGVQTSYD